MCNAVKCRTLGGPQVRIFVSSLHDVARIRCKAPAFLQNKEKRKDLWVEIWFGTLIGKVLSVTICCVTHCLAYDICVGPDRDYCLFCERLRR